MLFDESGLLPRRETPAGNIPTWLDLPDPRSFRPKRKYRTIWISDIHLGTRGCNASMLVDFLRSIDLPPGDLNELPDSAKRFPDGKAPPADLGKLLNLRLGVRHERAVVEWCEEALEALSAISKPAVLLLEDSRRENNG